ncbi:MAG: hypothetical protein HRU07_05705 [Nitrosopumilus sp.]|nr:hypothetical protein [Nitrosopumilus sp.]NRA05641.1 hypothetical protein [Nitrosopumilus sp.]
MKKFGVLMLVNPENTCLRCKGPIIFDEIVGEKFCTSCGFVQESQIIDYSNKDSISKDVLKKRSQEHHIVTNSNIHDGNMGSVIISPNIDYSGKKLTFQQKNFSTNIKKWEKRNRVITSNERRLVTYFQKVHHLKDLLRLSDTFVSKLFFIIRHAEKARVLESKKVDIAIVVLIHIAGKMINQPIPYTKLKKLFEFNSRKFNEYNNEIMYYLKIDSKAIITKVEFVFEKFCNDLGISPKFRKHGREIIAYCRKNDICMQKTNAVIAASVIHVVFMHCMYQHNDVNEVNLERITKVTGVSEGSILSSARKIRPIIIHLGITGITKEDVIISKTTKSQNNQNTCPHCLSRMIKASGEGYDTLNEEHVKYILGRICKKCKKIFINPKFKEYSFIVSSIGC